MTKLDASHTAQSMQKTLGPKGSGKMSEFFIKLYGVLCLLFYGL